MSDTLSGVSARPLLAVLLFLAAAFAGGSLLTPWAWLAVHGEPSLLPFLQIHDDFWRYLHRCVVGLAVLGLWPLARATGLASWSAVGMKRQPSWGRRLLLGWAAGVGSFAFLGALATALLPLRWAELGSVDWGKHLLESAVAMVLVPLIEELIHRGVLFGALRRALGWWLAAAGSSVLFSLSHFLDARPPNPEAVGWLSGLRLLPEMTSPIWGDAAGSIRFVTLLSAGLVLCALVKRTRDLYAAMGVHAGWILGGKTLTVVIVSGGPATVWWNARNFLESGAVAVMLSTMALAALVWAARGR